MKLHKQMYYFETTDVLPTIEDSTSKDPLCDGMVLAFDGCSWVEVYWKYVVQDAGKKYTHWMQLPKNPSSDDMDF